jgi:hypothetical protein
VTWIEEPIVDKYGNSEKEERERRERKKMSGKRGREREIERV